MPSKQVTKLVDNFVLKLITNFDLTGNPRSLCYKMVVQHSEILRKPFNKMSSLAYLQFIEMGK